ncbi:uncharacterized protein AB675_9279 [Cyphellophora attinorum]|uniref:Uncharacterized protein n=1 Tax=Cyphellophora attinorum TaxID=1664694 RepID=A0A0N1HW25_9EURO|nr:uncharacterized protein AB675_9279 [Phialophora attinorum]KPI41674.1 hypothetical protein AB675_9279 [Phialophora attinorum]
MAHFAQEHGVSLEPRITLSHQISSTGFLARENAAILNAALRPLAEKTISGFQKAMLDTFGDSPCALYLTQNDGSVLSAREAVELPIRTFNSGPTNSIRGGKFLWETANTEMDQPAQGPTESLAVIDIGGTTADSGLLLPNGLPRMSSLLSTVGGVRTNFALPAVESIGLGGGSVIRDGGESVGPDSVALELRSRAKLFGGDVLTATDIVAASEAHGLSQRTDLQGVGDPALLSDISTEIVSKAKRRMRQQVEDLVDRTKISKGDVDVLIVGGGAILIDTDEPLKGVRSARRVRGGEVANAVGAAISRVSGIVDIVADLSQQSIKQAQAQISRAAVEAAVSNGAEPDSVEIAEVTVLPVQYVDAKARIVARAVGKLDVIAAPTVQENALPAPPVRRPVNRPTVNRPTKIAKSVESTEADDLTEYKPTIKNGEWTLSVTDLTWISSGCKILGCGGGGDPYSNFLKVKSLIEQKPGSVKIVSAFSLASHNTVGWTGCIGSPEVSSERLAADECDKAHRELVKVMQLPPVDAFMALEIGGGNGLVNFELAAAHNVPVVDADFMGRAYPTGWQTTPNVYGSARGEALLPATIASGDGSFMTLTSTRTDRLVDKILRAACVEMGLLAGHAAPPKSAQAVQEQGVLNTVSLAWSIGRAIELEKNVADRPQRIIDAVGGSETARVLAQGKIVSVERVLRTGHSYGVAEIDGTLSDGSKATVSVPFKNENAYVEAVEAGQSCPRVLASVPDLIAVLDAETAQGLGTPNYKYGLKVVVIAITASPRWTDTARGLELGGPASMGFPEIEYVPVGTFRVPKSVIDLYGG